MKTRSRLAPLAGSLAALAACGLTLPAQITGPAPVKDTVVDIGSRLELFVDDALIATRRGVDLKLHEPRSMGTILTFDKPWEGNVSLGSTIFKDGDRYRLYYAGRAAENYVMRSGLREGETVVRDHPSFMCLAESRDGIVWTRPSLGLFEFQGSTDNNIVMDLKDGYPEPFLDTNPAVPANERYKGARAQPGGDGLYIFVSPDGLHWRKWREAPVFTSTLPGAFDSSKIIFWSASEGRYVCYFRFNKQSVRAMIRATSPDLIHWSEAVPLEFGDTPPEHFYAYAIQPYLRAPHIYVSFPWRFSPWRKRFEEMPSPGISDTLFMSTRDGVHGTRFMESFIRPGRDQRNWVHRTTAVSTGLIQTADDEISLYVSRHYTYPTNHLERFAIRVDGFTSAHAGYPEGEIVTRPLRFRGQSLILNYATSAAGSIRVEFLNAAGKPLPGFTLQESPILFGDEIAAAVTWARSKSYTDANPLKVLVDTPVRLRFVIQDADLYSFQFK